MIWRIALDLRLREGQPVAVRYFSLALGIEAAILLSRRAKDSSGKPGRRQRPTILIYADTY